MDRRGSAAARALAFAFVVAGASHRTARAQEMVQLPDGSMAVVGEDGELMIVGQGGPPQPGAPAAAPAKSERAKKLAALTFDRRPSTILETWSKPPESEKKAEAKPAEPGATKPADAPAPPAETPPPPADPAAAPTAVAPPPPAPPADETPEAKAAREAAEKQKAEQAAAAEKQKAEQAAAAKKKEEEAKALEAELKLFQRRVTLGEWDAVASYLKGLTEDEAKAGYGQLLRQLTQQLPPKPPANQELQQWAEKHLLSCSDVVALLRAAPVALDKAQEKTVAVMVTQLLDAGNALERLLELVRAELSRQGTTLTSRQVARILHAAKQTARIEEFLPISDEARASGDREALNLLSRLCLAKLKEDAKGGWLAQAWTLTLAALQTGEISDEDKAEALAIAVEIAPKVDDELGRQWLNESFTQRPERGIEILASIGRAASEGLTKQARDAEARRRGLELQTTAAEALLAAAPQKASEWSATLGLLASNWLREAAFSSQYDYSTSLGPRMQRDYYGNWFWSNSNAEDGDYPQQYYNRGNQPMAIPTGKLLELKPSEAWLAHVEAGLTPKFAGLIAQLYLKVGEEGLAFPAIERLATTHPRQAKGLTDEFLRVWARNHNPNDQTMRRNSYTYFYGYEQRADSIPLTRSKQERNLRELGGWVARLRALPGVELDEKLLASAFTNAHSTAEVYRLDAIESVFGALDRLGAKTLAQLMEQMRANLVGVWRQPAEQKDKKTRRTQKDLEAEVARGYATARETVARARGARPDEWRLALVDAALAHDENSWRGELASSSDWSSKRRAALDGFAAAARLYAAAAPALSTDEESADCYLTWFYAALGECDLGQVRHDDVLVEAEIPAIRAALDGLGGDAAKRHRTKFATTLFSRMSAANPAIKFRYARAGLEIAGDEPAAAEVREVCDYYEDLVTEITLDARLDGGAQVGHGRPFGVLVELRHTRDIERESGGFAKYFINQNNQSYSWNYGRPTENYRDKFEEAARETLKEQFEILSVTFNHPETRSRAEPEYGWRRTSYAYLLLQARGPEVDKVPSLRLDMDFLDTSGYAVLPVESPPIGIVAGDDATTRPFADLHVTQTLDERQAKDGRLVLEVKARAHGLPPSLAELLDVGSDGFDVAKVDELGLSVAEFDQEAATAALWCERSWMVTFAGKQGVASLPKTFTFATLRAPTEGEPAVMEYLRYADADLAKAEPVVALEAHYGREKSRWPWYVGIGVAIAAIAAAFVAWRKRRPVAVAAARFERPATVTPFTAIALLRQIARSDAVAEGDKAALAADLVTLEQRFFADEAHGASDLDALVDGWLRKAS